jgi:hypothetical protein
VVESEDDARVGVVRQRDDAFVLLLQLLSFASDSWV